MVQTFCIYYALLLPVAATVPFLGTAGIFGGNNNNNNHGRTSKLPPPPPPRDPRTEAFGTQRRPHQPPPSGLEQLKVSVPSSGDHRPTGNKYNSSNQTNNNFQRATNQDKPPPPPPKVMLMFPDGTDRGSPEAPPHHQSRPSEVFHPPWPPVDEQQQQQFAPPLENQWYMLQYDLDMALQREQALLAELHNRTQTLDTAFQREKLHTHQLDVLTERVMQVETLAARDRNELVELEANCTDLLAKLADQEGIVEDLERTCEELKELRVKDEEKLHAWKRKWKDASREAEDLAIRIERHRLSEYEDTSSRKKKRGFFSWLFGSRQVADDDDQDDHEETQERARSNLLGALRTERNTVAELESALASLQQNNTAIAQQMTSRDRIIQELNDRIAVFEDDKIVLKAALKQLQKEMHEETPKLFEAENEVERLTREVNALNDSHAKQVSSLKKTLKQKQQKIATTESNLTTIEAYVGKLEERLGDFTVAKREIEKREGACADAEMKASAIEQSGQKLQARVAELEEEHEELKKLLSELAQQKTILEKQQEELKAERASLLESVEALRLSFARAEEETLGLKDQAANLTSRLHQAAESTEHLQKRLNESEVTNAELRKKIDGASLSQNEQVRAMEEAIEMKTRLEQQLDEAKGVYEVLLADHRNVTSRMNQELEKEKTRSQKLAEAVQRASAESKVLSAKVLQKESEAREATVRLFEMTKRLESRIPQHHTSRTQNVGESAPSATTRLNTAQTRVQTTNGAPQANAPDQVKARRPLHQQPMRHESTVPGRSIQEETKSSPLANRPFSKKTPTNKIPPNRPHGAVPKRQFGAGASNSGIRAVVPLHQKPQLQKERSVPFRSLRKFLSRTTGIHGLFTRPSSTPNKNQKNERPRQELNATLGTTVQQNATQVPLNLNATSVQPQPSPVPQAQNTTAPLRTAGNTSAAAQAS